MQIDRAGLRVLTHEECLALLASAEIGRIALSARALPLILPVRFAMDGDRIVIATHDGTTLASATRDTVVAFETDGAASDGHVGWSVHVNGVARHVTDPSTLDRLAALPLPSWSADKPARFVAISTDQVAGRSEVDVTARAAGVHTGR
jgi:nitroimidazol reductase NimA-like FMN-containing flavoprotein (pyridoxamine 5'-phosphate oxidase superfamily)